MSSQKRETGIRVLVAPLDWGLGHASRCIPIIQSLQKRGCHIYIAARSPLAELFREVFPSTPIIDIPSYNIRYSQKIKFLYSIIPQIPSLIASIKEEHEWLKETVRALGIDRVISDNRYGLWSETTPSVIITHQLELPMPPLQFLSGFASAYLAKYIRRFKECWIPDLPGEENLSGALSHLKKMPTHARFIGPLSRFRGYHNDPENKEVKKDILALAILSGPEPQRTVFENIIRQQLPDLKGKSIIIQGIPDSHKAETQANINIYPHKDTSSLASLMARSKLIISRSGYSSVMDITTTGNKALFIPTPGQGEQEYLAKQLREKGLFHTVSQKDLNLKQDCEKALTFPGWKLNYRGELLDEAIDRLINC